MTDNSKRIRVAQKTILETGRFLKSRFLNIHEKIKIKSDGSPFIPEDKKSEDLIISAIRKHFPGDSFVSEESPPEKVRDIVWIIDPLCGSYSFLRGVETWSISIALVVNGVYEAGFVYQPLLETFFNGVRGEGVFRNQKQVFPSQVSSLGQSFVSIEHDAISDPKIDFMKLVKAVKRIRVGHGSGLELAYVASGSLDAVIKTGQTAEHYSGGRALLEITGGMFVRLKRERIPVITDKTTKVDYIAGANNQITNLLAETISVS